MNLASDPVLNQRPSVKARRSPRAGAALKTSARWFLVCLVAATGALIGTTPRTLRAASQTWSSTPGSGDWGTTGNWVGNAVPGSTSGTTNADTATFLTSSTTTITNAAIFNIKGITFGASGSTPSAFTIGTTGGSAFDLSSAGTIQISSGVTGSVTETVNAPLVLEPASSTTAGTYTFTNNSASDVLNFSGAISGGTTSSTVTLTLNGTDTGADGTISGAISNGGATGHVALTVSGSGTWILSGANAYTGATSINSGILNYQNGTAFGTNSAITVASGATAQVQGGITGGSNTLKISGAGASGATGALENVSGTNAYGGLITLGAAATISSDAGTLTLSNTGTITGATFGLTLTGAGNGTIASIVGTTTGTLTKNGLGTWILSGANTYTGATNINAGILNYQNLTAFGGHSAITVASGATAQVQGSITGTGTSAMTISGSGATGATGALENVSGTNTYAGLLALGAAATISSDAGTLTLSNTGTILGSGDALTLTGGGNGTIASIIGTGAGTLTKSGVGTWTLTKANTYTGLTTVAAGTLALSGAGAVGTSTGASGLTVDTGATFSYAPGTAGSLTLATGSTLTLQSNSSIAMPWNTSDKIAAQTATVGGNVFLNLSGTPTNATPYTLLTATAGSLSAGATYYPVNTNYLYTESSSATAVTVTPTTATALTSAYWVGGFSAGNVWAMSNGSSTGSNWAATTTGTAQGLVPGSAATVYISDTGSINSSPASTTLGANMAVAGLVIQDTTHGLGLNGDGNTLTITPTATANGITMNASVPASTIGANVALGATQIWTNNSANTLTVSGVVSGSNTLETAGSGTINLSGANAYTGATTVFQGTLSVTGSLSSTSVLQLGGGTFSFSGSANQTVAGLTIEAAGGSVITNTNTGSTPVLALGAITRASLIAGQNPAGGTLDFSTASASSNVITTTMLDTNGIIGGWATQGGEATWAVSGATAGTYPITGLANASYQPNTASSLGASSTGNTDMTVPSSGSGTTSVGATTINSLRFNTAAADTITTSGLITISSGGILETSSVAANPDSIGGAGSLKGASGTDLVVIQNNTAAALTISVPIVDNSVSSLTKSGAGTLILTGVETYAGETDVNAGTVILKGTGTIANTGGFGLVNGNFVVASTASIPVNVSGATDTNFWIGGFWNGDFARGVGGVANFYIAPQVTGTIEQTNSQTIAIGTFGAGIGTVFQESGTLSYPSTNTNDGIYLAVHGGNGTLDVSSPSGAATTSIVTTGSAGHGAIKIAFTQPNEVGTLNLNGGTVTVTGPSNFQVGGSGGGQAIVNLNGGTNYSGGNGSTGSGTLQNSNGGTLQTQGWVVGGSAVAPVLNFNGGKLQAGAASTNFLNSTVATPDTVVKIFANGGTIDTDGVNITITEALNNASGTGVTGVSFTSTADVFTVPPTVTFSGDATGYATLDSTGVINGIAVTYGGTASTEIASISGYSGTLMATTALNSTGGLTKIGLGTLTLSATNTYSGPTNVNAGTLLLTTGTLGSGGGTAISSAATFTENSGGVIAGASSLNVTAGTTSLAGVNTYTGATSVSAAGTLSLTGTLGSSGGTAISSAATFTETSAGAIVAASSLTVTAGTTSLAGVNSYTGATMVSAGSLSLTGTLGSSGGTAISSAATFTETSAGVIAGASSLTVTAGTTSLAGTNTYTGATTVSGGTLRLGDGAATSPALGNTAISVSGGAMLAVQPAASPNNTVLAGLTSVAGAGATLNLGSGTLDMTGTSNIGTFALQQEGTFSGTALTLAGATLKFNASTSAVDQLLVNGPSTIASVSGTNLIVINPLGTSLPVNSFPLIQLPAGSSGLLGTTFDFALTGTTMETLTLTGGVYDLSLAPSATAETLTIVQEPRPTWQPTDPGIYNWSSPTSNWSFSVPQNPGDKATFGVATASDETITVDQATISVGTLTFNNPGVSSVIGNYTIAGSGSNTLALDNGGASATAALINSTGNNVISAPVQFNSIITADVAAATSLTLSGPLTGSTPLNVNPDFGNTGTLYLSGSNTSLSSPITLYGGTLNFANGSLGSGTLTFAGGSTLQYAGGNTQDVSGQIQAIPTGVVATIDTGANTVSFGTGLTGSGGLTKAGAGTLNLTGANTYTGSTGVNAGTLILSGAGTMVGQGGAAIVNGNFVVASTASGPIFNVSGSTNATNFWIGGAPPSTAGVANVYIAPQVTGTVEQTNSQTIAIGAYGAGTVFQESGTLSYGGTNSAGISLGLDGGDGTLNVSSPPGAASISSVTTGTGALAIASTQSSDVGTLNVNGGTVRVTASTAGSNFQVGGTGGGQAIVNLNGGTLQTQNWLVGGSTVAPVLNFNGGTLQANQASTNFLNSTAKTPDTVVKIFANGGTIDTNGNNITITEALANASGTGVTGVSFTSTSDIFTVPPTVTFSGDATGYATLDSNGLVNGIAVTNGGTVSGQTASISGYSGALTVNTALNNTGGLTKVGAGTLTLSAANTYAGPTNVQNGTLALTGSLSGSTSVTLGSATGPTSGVLQLGGASAVNQTIAGLFTSGSGTGNAVVGGASAVSTLTIANSVPDTFAGTLGGALTNQNNLALTVAATGGTTLTLTGVNTYTGITTVGSSAASGGTLIIGGNGSLGSIATPMGGLQVINGVLVVSSTAANPITTTTALNDDFYIGGNGTGGGTGTFYIGPQVTGTITATTGNKFITVGNGPGAVGTVFQEGGTLTYAGSNASDGLVMGANGTGIFPNNATGVYNISGGAVSIPSPVGLIVNLSGNGNAGTLNVNGGTITANGTFIMGASGQSGPATVNLNGGTLRTQGLSANPGTASTFNFNGGTLKAIGTPLSPFLATLSAVDIYAGGAAINTNSLSITIANPLVNPAGTAVTSVAYSNPSGNVYITPPTVTFSGDATGYATLDSSGDISGIAVTYGGTASGETASISGDSGTLTVTSAPNSTGGLTVTGGGTLTLSSSFNTYTGPTSIQSGTLMLTGTLGSGFGGGTAISSAATFTESSAGAIVGASSLNVTGGMTSLAGTNTYTGPTTVSGGTLEISSPGSLASATVGVDFAAALTVDSGASLAAGTNLTNDGTVNLNNATQTIATLNGGGTGLLNLNSNTLTVSGGGTFGGSITGASGALNVTGGALTLSAGSSYGGPTTVSGGTLTVANGTSGSATGTGNVTLNGGTLAGSAGAGGSIGGAVLGGTGPHIIAPGAGLSPGTFGTLTLNNGLTTNNNTTLNFNLATSSTMTANGSPVYIGDLLNVNNGLTVDTTNGNSAITFGANPTALGDYRLIGGSFGTPTIANFDLPSPSSGLVYSLQANPTGDPGYIDLVVTPSGPPPGSGTWTNGVGDYKWTSGNNWTSGQPSGAGYVATFDDTGYAATRSSTPCCSGAAGQVVGGIVLNTSTGGYTIGGAGDGALTMNNSDNAAATITVNGGAHTIAANLLLAEAMGTTISVAGSGNSLSITGAINNGGNPLTVSGAGNTTVSGAISGAGSLTMNGAGILTLGGTVPSTYHGGTTVNSGTLRTTADGGALGDGPLTVNAAVSLGGNESIGTLSGSGGSVSVAAGKTLSVNQGADMNFAGNLTLGTTGSGASLALTGSNKLSLTGSATLNSNSTISVGDAMNSTTTLRINATSASTVGTNVSVTVNSSATLELDGMNSALQDGSVLLNRATISNDGTLVVGNASVAPLGTTQQVGGIDGSGSVVVGDAVAANLTADHINQTSLVIGANSTFTLAPSGPDGSPMAGLGGGLVLAGGLAPSSGFIASSGNLLGVGSASSSPAASLGGGLSGGGVVASAVLSRFRRSCCCCSVAWESGRCCGASEAGFAGERTEGPLQEELP